VIDRRTFLAGIAALAASHNARAQSMRKVFRIGVIGITASADLAGPNRRSRTVGALLRGVRELGYVYGEHFVTETRGSESRPERLPGLAAELVGLQVDVIVATGVALPALKQATSTIPVVMAAASDPVGAGYVQSLSRPGGNITGMSLQATEMTAKRLELLSELVPAPSPLGIIWHRDDLPDRRAAEEAARNRGWKTLSLEIGSVGQIEAVFKAAADARAGAVIMFASSVLFPHARRVAEQAARSRLPAIYLLRPYVDAGGLISYGPDIREIWRRAAVFVDKILKGAKPADIPVEQPTKFDLVINLKTAKALGLTVRQALLLRADEVIQ
jgi:putative ABC transport system substrate-binding protein